MSTAHAAASGYSEPSAAWTVRGSVGWAAAAGAAGAAGGAALPVKSRLSVAQNLP